MGPRCRQASKNFHLWIYSRCIKATPSALCSHIQFPLCSQDRRIARLRYLSHNLSHNHPKVGKILTFLLLNRLTVSLLKQIMAFSLFMEISTSEMILLALDIASSIRSSPVESIVARSFCNLPRISDPDGRSRQLSFRCSSRKNFSATNKGELSVTRCR